MLKLGNIQLPLPFFQAPLSGYSDRAMRAISRRHGAPLTFSGVILAQTAMHPQVLRRPAFAPADDEHPVGAQLLGNDPAMMARAAGQLQDIGYDLVDLNFACPAPKVLRRHRGGFLLTQPTTVLDIVRRVRDTVTCPLLIKLRTAYDHDYGYDNLWWICSHAIDAGVDAIVLHGRTVMQRFRDHADWHIVAQAKAHFPQTTIIGSGDIFEPADITARLTLAGPDGVIVARGAVGNPWIFARAAALIQGENIPAPTIAQQGRVILDHYNMVLDLYPPAKATPYFNKFSVRYCRLHPQRRAVQQDLLTATTPDAFRRAVKHWYQVE